jgi:hypothetical protein
LGDPPVGGDPQPFAVPDKFMVAGQDGQPDFKAIVEKMGQSYTHLEKRFGTGDLPPKTADEYKLEPYLPEGMEANQEAMQPIMGKFHAAGLTNAQVQVVMSTFGERLAAGLEIEKAGYQAGQAALKTAWGEQYEQNIGTAKTALAAYTATDADLAAALNNPKYANDPVIIRLLAAVGGDLKEDRPANDMQGAAAESIDELRTSKAYLDKTDPGHADAVRKVNEAYSKGYKATRA